MTDKKLSLKRLWVLMVTAFVDMIGFALILPLLPFYATDFGASPLTVGLLMAIFALAQLLSAPLWGKLSDRAGRRPIIIGGQCLAGVAFVVFAFSNTVWMLFLSRMFQGIGAGTLAATQAYVSDAVGPEERAKALGWITAATSAGVMIGPAIASLSVGYDRAAPGLIAAFLCLLNILFAWRWLPESSTRRAGQPVVPSKLREDILRVLKRPAETVHVLIWIYTGGMMAFMAMNGVMALYLASRFGITEKTIGGFYVVVGFVSVIMRAVILGRFVARFGEVRTLRFGATALGLGMAIAPFAHTPWLFLLTILLIPSGTALLFPSTTSLVSRFADQEQVGKALGVQQAFGGVSRLLGPIWAGAVFQSVGEAVPFWIGGGLVLVTLIFSFQLQAGAAPKSAGPADISASA